MPLCPDFPLYLRFHQHRSLNPQQLNSLPNTLRPHFAVNSRQLSNTGFRLLLQWLWIPKSHCSYIWSNTKSRSKIARGAPSWTYYYQRLAGHPSERSRCDTMRREVYWPHMASSVYTTVNDCVQCACNRANKKQTQQLNLFLASNLFEFIIIDTLSPLPRRTNGNQFVKFMNDRNSKFTRPATTWKQVQHIYRPSSMTTGLY